VDAKAHRKEGIFELKALTLEPGLKTSDRFVRDIAAAVQRCADWHQCPHVKVVRGDPAAFGAALQALLDGEALAA
jgi:uncharacterized protein YcaQ